jgi:dienelactone hydrolase
MDKKRLILIGMVMIAALLLAACSPAPAEEPGNAANGETDGPSDPDSAEGQTEEQGGVTEETEQEAAPPVTDPDFDPQPPDPQMVEIPSADGRILEGYYFPASVPDAPVVVLMHWAGGNFYDWTAIAPWLQNRSVVLDWPDADVDGPWLDPSWFPSMPEGVSFAVLVFNYGGYGNSPGGSSRQALLDDSLTAIQYASSLPGVDPHRISALGASIGADGAADGCYLFNDLGELGTCVGAFSLSPGDYLTDQFTYQEAVSVLDLDGRPVWCLSAVEDGGSARLCQDLMGDLARRILYAGSNHGMRLILPDYYPTDPAVELDTMQLIQEFLEEVYGLTLNDVSLP